jgi:hypothetical protein
VAFFVAAAIAAVLAVTSGWWLPTLPTLFGAIEANSELIGALADLTQIVTFVMLVIGPCWRTWVSGISGVPLPERECRRRST